MGTGTWAVQTAMDAVMTWNYDVEHPELRALYEKAKREQWNATTQLPWTHDVDPEGMILDDEINPNVALLRDSDIWRRMTPKEQVRLRYETLAWNLSQFLHGEQLVARVALGPQIPRPASGSRRTRHGPVHSHVSSGTGALAERAAALCASG